MEITERLAKMGGTKVQLNRKVYDRKFAAGGEEIKDRIFLIFSLETAIGT
jgi:hypothetical protein